MFNQRKQRLTEVIVITVIGAIVSFINTLWLRSSLVKEIERIAKTNELNILRQNGKLTDIAPKQQQREQKQQAEY